MSVIQQDVLRSSSFFVFVALFGALFFERVSSEVILQLVIRSLFKLTGLIFIYIYI